jgi:cell division septum initiation protein DivIVA
MSSTSVLARVSPADITGREFPRQFGGYQVAAVDRFRENLSREWDNLLTGIEELEREVRRLNQENEQLRQVPVPAPAEHQAGEILRMAQRTADIAVGEAQQKAAQIAGSAQHEAQQLVSHARQQAEALLADARRKADDMLGDAARRAEATVRQARAQAEAEKTRIISEATAESRSQVDHLTRLAQAVQSGLSASLEAVTRQAGEWGRLAREVPAPESVPA